MPFRFSIDPSERLISFWGEGCATNEELVAAAAKMFGDPMFNPEFSFLADLTEVTDNRLSSGVVGQIAKSSRFTSSSRRAYVVREHSAERELFRVLEFNVSLFKSGVPRVFPDRSSALQWLRSPAGRD